jgi:methionyl-tRNA synthetase
MAADLPIPRQIVSHGWWLMEGAKMSKSVGNVVRPEGYAERFGVDALRYFVYREMTFGQDASFTDEAILTRYNADLANDLGNLVSRATTMMHRYTGGMVPAADPGLMGRGEEVALTSTLDELVPRVQSAVQSFQLSVALRDIWDAIGAINRYIVTREPWRLAKDPTKRAEVETATRAAADGVRLVAELVRPFMPDTGDRALRMLGIEPASRSWREPRCGALSTGARLGEAKPLFPRIEQSVEDLQTMTSEPGGTPGDRAQPITPHESASAAQAQPTGDRISIEDFLKVELRVAKILAAERVPKSTKLLKLLVDAGEQRTIVAGIAEAYDPDTLVGRTVVVVFNLKPAKLMGVESNGMVLAASPEGGKPVLVSFEQAPEPGTRIR